MRKAIRSIIRYKYGILTFTVAVLTVTFAFIANTLADEKAAPAAAPSAGRPDKASPEDVEAGKAIYFKKCVWCHGPQGAGDGPSADRLWPRPRNFNAGTFKIRHTGSGELPTEQDLFLTEFCRTLRHGR